MDFIPRTHNPANCPELHPIEQYWVIIKTKLCKKFREVKSSTDFKKKWDKTTTEYRSHLVQNLMAPIKRKIRKLYCTKENYYFLLIFVVDFKSFQLKKNQLCSSF